MNKIQQDAQTMISRIIASNMPTQAVTNALEAHTFTGRVHLIAIGKAAWTMTKAAVDFLGDNLAGGIVITKYGHAQGELQGIEIYEAGHPIADENTIAATEKCIQLAAELGSEDELLFLVSGGGSALFEKPLGVSLLDVQDITSQLLASGADIVEMNMIRKRLSAVKGGRFAKVAAPCKIFSIVLSDVLGDRLDTIASGPAVADTSTVEDALRVMEKYNLQLTVQQRELLLVETPKQICNVKTVITGSVRTLCAAAADTARELGYMPIVLTTTLNCEAREAGRFLSAIASDVCSVTNAISRPCAIIAGGETVVTVRGNGKGGRNQELALSAACGIEGLDGVVIFSIGSDGTDGPTDAAGGVVDGASIAHLKAAGLNVDKLLAENDSYNGLAAIGGLVVTGPTGTNVNDVAVVLVG